MESVWWHNILGSPKVSHALCTYTCPGVCPTRHPCTSTSSCLPPSGSSREAARLGCRWQTAHRSWKWRLWELRSKSPGWRSRGGMSVLGMSFVVMINRPGCRRKGARLASLDCKWKRGAAGTRGCRLQFRRRSSGAARDSTSRHARLGQTAARETRTPGPLPPPQGWQQRPPTWALLHQLTSLICLNPSQTFNDFSLLLLTRIFHTGLTALGLATSPLLLHVVCSCPAVVWSQCLMALCLQSIWYMVGVGRVGWWWGENEER